MKPPKYTGCKDGECKHLSRATLPLCDHGYYDELAQERSCDVTRECLEKILRLDREHIHQLHDIAVKQIKWMDLTLDTDMTTPAMVERIDMTVEIVRRTDSIGGKLWNPREADFYLRAAISAMIMRLIKKRFQDLIDKQQVREKIKVQLGHLQSHKKHLLNHAKHTYNIVRPNVSGAPPVISLSGPGDTSKPGSYTGSQGPLSTVLEELAQVKDEMEKAKQHNFKLELDNEMLLSDNADLGFGFSKLLCVKQGDQTELQRRLVCREVSKGVVERLSANPKFQVKFISGQKRKRGTEDTAIKIQDDTSGLGERGNKAVPWSLRDASPESDVG